MIRCRDAIICARRDKYVTSGIMSTRVQNIAPLQKKVARRGAPPYVEIIVCYVLANQNLGGFLALYADVETVSGVVYTYTLEVVVYYGSVSIFGDDVVDT